MTVEEVRGSLDLTDNGAIKNSIRNCLTVFQNDPVLQGAVRYNILTERIDIVKPLWWSKQTATLTDTDLNYLMLYLEDKYSLTSEKKIQKALSIIADSNKYHPIRDYLNGLEWDGTERIRYALPRFLGAEEGEYTYQALRLFMLGAISRVFKPGCKFEVMLCLVGGQGAGKSTFFRLLAVKDEWFSDDLKKIDDDNVYRKMQGHWIIEMSEMIATANAKSIEYRNFRHRLWKNDRNLLHGEPCAHPHGDLRQPRAEPHGAELPEMPVCTGFSGLPDLDLCCHLFASEKTMRSRSP